MIPEGHRTLRRLLATYDATDSERHDMVMFAQDDAAVHRALIAHEWAHALLRVAFLAATADVNSPDHAAVVDVDFIRRCAAAFARRVDFVANKKT